MNIKMYQVDAFTSNIFSGNPAAVCQLEEWLTDEIMQNIAMENALAETAFIVPVEQSADNQQADTYHIRWFTPEIEMDLCGHATLATAHVLRNHLNYSKSEVRLNSNSGDLLVSFKENLITLDFPSRMPEVAQAPTVILEALEIEPIEILKSRDYVLVYDNEDVIKQMQPNRSILDRINLDPGGIIITAKGNDVDFVSRYFTPSSVSFEDPVTGSAHCSLIPYWADKLSKNTLIAKQLSAREGTLYCENKDDRVLISGEAVTYMVATINI